MFGTYDQYNRKLQHHVPQLSDGTILVAAASLAGITEGAMCPFERIQTVLQDKTFHGKYKDTFHVCKSLERHGVREFYRGVMPILYRNVISNIIFFSLRTPLKNAISYPIPQHQWYGDLLTDFMSGAVVGAAISTLLFPFNVLKTHQQRQIGGPCQAMYRSFLSIYRSSGNQMRRLYSGVHVNNLRSILSWGIVNASYEIVQRVVPGKHNDDNVDGQADTIMYRSSKWDRDESV